MKKIGIFCNIIVLCFSVFSYAGLCPELLWKKASKKFTQDSQRDFHEKAESFEALSGGANAIVTKLFLSTGETFVEKHYLYRKSRTEPLKVKELTARKNLLGDLVRFRYYEKLKDKYSLNFKLVDRYQAGPMSLVTKFIDGLHPFVLFKMNMTEEVQEYNHLVVSIIKSTLKDREVNEDSFIRALIGVQTEKKVVMLYKDSKNLDEFLRHLDEAKKINYPISVGMNLKNSKKDFSFHALIPENFVYDFDTGSFVLIDPI